MPDQPSLFDPASHGLDAPSLTSPARSQFVAGMLGAWLYGEQTVPKAARDSLLGLADRTLAEAARIKELRS
jgi:hypothetical protein